MSIRRRIWTGIVGVTMIAMTLVAGGIIAGLIAIPVALGVNYLFGLEGDKPKPSCCGTMK